MEALVDVVLGEGVAGFSVQSVADRAGVSHRTVYRHFPSREALLEGLVDYLESPMRSRGLPGVPESFDELVEAIGPVFGFFEDHARMIEAMVVVRLALGREPGRSHERTLGFVKTVRREAPHLSAEQARSYGLALRSLASSQHWYTLTRRLDLSAEAAAAVTAETLRALIGEIRRRNARQRPKGES